MVHYYMLHYGTLYLLYDAIAANVENYSLQRNIQFVFHSVLLDVLAFSALTPSVGCDVEHPACKN